MNLRDEFYVIEWWCAFCGKFKPCVVLDKSDSLEDAYNGTKVCRDCLKKIVKQTDRLEKSA